MPRFTESISPFSSNPFAAERDDRPKSPFQGLRSDGTYDTSGYSAGNTKEEEEQARANLLQLRRDMGEKGKAAPKNAPALTRSRIQEMLNPGLPAPAESKPAEQKPQDSYMNPQAQEDTKLHARRLSSSQPDIEKPQDGKLRGFFRKQGRGNERK